MPDSRRIVPRCLTGVGHYVSATGHYYPCCWAANATTYRGSFFEAHEAQLDLSAHSLEEVLASEAMRVLVASWERFDDAPRASARLTRGVEVEIDGTSSPVVAQDHAGEHLAQEAGARTLTLGRLVTVRSVRTLGTGCRSPSRAQGE